MEIDLSNFTAPAVPQKITVDSIPAITVTAGVNLANPTDAAGNILPLDAGVTLGGTAGVTIGGVAGVTLGNSTDAAGNILPLEAGVTAGVTLSGDSKNPKEEYC